MSQLRSEIPLMASLWIRSGYDMKAEMSAETYKVGVHFKPLIKALLVAPLKSFERFFRISSSPARLCKPSNVSEKKERLSLPLHALSKHMVERKEGGWGALALL